MSQGVNLSVLDLVFGGDPSIPHRSRRTCNAHFVPLLCHPTFATNKTKAHCRFDDSGRRYTFCPHTTIKKLTPWGFLPESLPTSGWPRRRGGCFTCGGFALLRSSPSPEHHEPTCYAVDALPHGDAQWRPGPH